MSVDVRDARESDAPALCDLWSEHLVTPAGIEAVDGGVEGSAVRAVARVDGDPSTRIVVAEVDGDVVGCAYLRSSRVSPLDEEPVVHLSHLEVDPEATRQDVALALVESALSWAEQQGVGTVAASTGVNDREANRFLARLGLAQGTTVRSVPVAALRARIPHDPSAVARDPARLGRSVQQVVAARRSQRRARGVRPVGAAD